MSTAKKNILNKIKAALTTSTRLPFPASEGTDSVFQPLQQDIVVEFAEQFTQLQGKFDFCMDTRELAHHFGQLCQQNSWTKIYCADETLKSLLPGIEWYNDLESCDTAITGCEALVARTGSLLLSANSSGRVTSVYAPIHICIAYTSQLVYNIKEALQMVQHKYNGNIPSMVSLATGPSRTADIEKTLVVGVHGPKEVYCFLVENLA